MIQSRQRLIEFMLHCNLLSAKSFREVRFGWQRSLVTMTVGHQKIQS
ncbi:hypothetical protein VCR29J2_50160 [Vibrio coralliirubri]|nr:hypothetical protein VCR29J2_50160 [Vibrio coralliirubri]